MKESLKLIICGSMKEARRHQDEFEKVLHGNVLGPIFEPGMIRIPGLGSIMFVTPDQPDRVMGRQFSEYVTYGTAYDHPKIHKMLDEVKWRIFPIKP